MGYKTKMDDLLKDVRELEKQVAEMQDAEIYPVSFFSRTFDLSHKILNDLHELESSQIEVLRKQMEEHQALINAIPPSQAQPQPQPVVPEVESKPIEHDPPLEKHSVSLNDVLEKQSLSDLRKAISLNDRFYFRKELFNGDEAKMNKVISDLNEIHSYEDSIAYLNERLNWNTEDQTVADFIKLLEKRFR